MILPARLENCSQTLDNYNQYASYGKQAFGNALHNNDLYCQQAAEFIKNSSISIEAILKTIIREGKKYNLPDLCRAIVEMKNQSENDTVRLELAEILYSLIIVAEDPMIKNRARMFLKYL